MIEDKSGIASMRTTVLENETKPKMSKKIPEE